jgi:hypothetical protein
VKSTQRRKEQERWGVHRGK